MLNPFKFCRTTLLIAVSILTMTGSHPAMSTQTNPKIEPPAQTLAVPLKFKLHNFQAFCYSTLTCRVIYDKNDFTRLFEEKSAPAPSSTKYKEAWGTASYLGIKNFPAPAEVRWKSHDGIAHEAEVDIGAIFKDELIWHNVPKAEMADFYSGPYAGDPDIFLEVNDHTINVYMTTLIPTKTEQIPGNKYSFSRDDLFLAWSRTY